MDDIDREIVRQDAVVAASNVAVGAMLAGTVAFAAGRWWVGVAAAAVAATLTAAADRSRAGARATVAVGVLALGGVVWTWATDAVALGVVPVVLVGLGAGFGLYRLAFGVVRPVPAARRRRERSA